MQILLGAYSYWEFDVTQQAVVGPAWNGTDGLINNGLGQPWHGARKEVVDPVQIVLIVSFWVADAPVHHI